MIYLTGSVAFAYVQVLGVRLLPILLALAILQRILDDRHLPIQSFQIFIPLIAIFAVVATYSVFSFRLNALLSIFCFILIGILVSAHRENHKLQKVVQMYVCFAVLNALLVIIQIVFYVMYNVQFLRLEFYGGRIAFSGLWSDFSVLSIYLTSAVPLAIWSLKSKYFLSWSASIILLLGAFLTTARAGLVAILLFGIIILIVKILQFIVTLKLSKHRSKTWLFISISAFASATFIVFNLELLSIFYNRENVSSDSSRIASYLVAINFINENIYFGTLFNDEFYKSNYGYLPHNSILYIWVSGGSVVFVLFVAWLLNIIYLISLNKIKELNYAICIAAIGSLFVPSVFSMYFLAFLYGLLQPAARYKS